MRFRQKFGVILSILCIIRLRPVLPLIQKALNKLANPINCETRCCVALRRSRIPYQESVRFRRPIIFQTPHSYGENLSNHSSFDQSSECEPDPLSTAESCLVEAFASPFGVGLRATRDIKEWEPLVRLPLKSALGVRHGDPSPFTTLDDETWNLLPW
jgi:hypothetical protein